MSDNNTNTNAAEESKWIEKAIALPAQLANEYGNRIRKASAGVANNWDKMTEYHSKKSQAVVDELFAKFN